MANASAEKLKLMALRHGEKVVMALASVTCVLLLFLAISRPTIETTPEAISKAAEDANRNLNTTQNPDDILQKLEEAQIKNPNFEKMVDEQTKNVLVADNYKVANPWVTNEPGAGLIRDTPELIALSDLYAFPGRGRALVYELDENGERILDEETDATKEENTPQRQRSRQRTMAGMMPGMGMGMGPMGGVGGGGRRRSKKSAAQIEAEEEKAYQLEKKRKERQLVDAGKKGATEEKPAEKEEEALGKEGPWKEVSKGLRWVAITGVLDYKTLRDNYVKALKRNEIAYPHFKGLEVERQVLEADGNWSAWESVDSNKNAEIVNNLPEEEEELTPADVRIGALVDPLPFLKAGFWERVHVASLVPEEKKKIERPNMAGDMENMMGPMGAMGNRMGGAMAGMGPMGEMGAMGPMGGMGMAMGGMGMGGGATETIDFETKQADTLMVRSLDFTIDPDHTYRFRLRLVVYNPNRNRQDVSPGVDTTSPTLTGPWSEPTNDVRMPADIATYAMHKTQGPGRRGEAVQFQVTRWDPTDGFTVVKAFDAGPGDFIGETTSARIPSTDGTKEKAKSLDFDSRSLVLDTTGGSLPIPKDLNVAGRIDEPALSLLFQPDGTVVLRKQSNDLQDDVRKTISDNYKRELDESGKKRENSLGSGGGSRSMMMMMGGGGGGGRRGR
ncbi:hypothetical protein [Singulisphaera sp. PoT]|uniref:hypothetical protein n=1 Tax=Singulisphaera sp. PoT TaxID=3411797 RepID=UPI003BF572A1